MDLNPETVTVEELLQQSLRMLGAASSGMLELADPPLPHKLRHEAVLAQKEALPLVKDDSMNVVALLHAIQRLAAALQPIAVGTTRGR